MRYLVDAQCPERVDKARSQRDPIIRASGQAMPVKDSLIAATALVHDLIVVTRNRADFQKAGVEIVDPFAV